MALEIITGRSIGNPEVKVLVDESEFLIAEFSRPSSDNPGSFLVECPVGSGVSLQDGLDFVRNSHMRVSQLFKAHPEFPLEMPVFNKSSGAQFLIDEYLYTVTLDDFLRPNFLMDTHSITVISGFAVVTPYLTYKQRGGRFAIEGKINLSEELVNLVSTVARPRYLSEPEHRQAYDAIDKLLDSLPRLESQANQ